MVNVDLPSSSFSNIISTSLEIVLGVIEKTEKATKEGGEVYLGALETQLSLMVCSFYMMQRYVFITVGISGRRTSASSI